MKTGQLTKIEKISLYLLFFELFAGGGGRIFELGPISIREFLFAFVILLFCLRFIVNPETRSELIHKDLQPKSATLIMSALLIIWVGVSALIGISHGHLLGSVITDTIRVIFVIMIIPLSYYIDKKRFGVKQLVTTLMYAALITSLITIIISLAGKFMGNRDFYYFYKFINGLFPGDLFFRPSRGVFYKSHFLVLFAAIISFINLSQKKSTLLENIVLVVGSISIIMSETRGLYIGFAIGIITLILVKAVIYFFGDRESLGLSKKSFLQSVFLIILALGLTSYFFNNSTISRFSSNDNPQEQYGNKDHEHNESKINDVSLNVRVRLLADSVKIVKKSAANLLLGNGYGTVIGERSTGIEMTFIDIMVEQGFIGVVIWLLFSLLPLYYFFRSFLVTKRLDDVYIGLLGCVLAMLVVTNINPFLNSPIGLGFLLPVIIISSKCYFNSVAQTLGEDD